MRLLLPGRDLVDENVERLENRLAGWRMHTVWETILHNQGMDRDETWPKLGSGDGCVDFTCSLNDNRLLTHASCQTAKV
jgi:hypothetical protein